MTEGAGLTSTESLRSLRRVAPVKNWFVFRKGVSFFHMISVDTVRDSDSSISLHLLLAEEAIRKNRLENVRTILVVLSGRTIAFDDAALRQKILMTYPQAKVYFMSTEAYPLGEKLPNAAKVDLLIDFTGPGHRHKWLWARKLRALSKVCVGRPAGFFREFIYDRLFDDAKHPEMPRDVNEREREAQRQVLALAGVPVSHQGNLKRDQSHTIAAKLPALKNTK